jgi:5-oxoprolinase (ATP-hydrolysing)
VNETLVIAVDRGGTFTDCVAHHPDGHIETLKLLSHDPSRTEDAVVAGVRRLSAGHDGPILVKMGTTVATNALLERRGRPTLLLVTQGFQDALLIGNQSRPDIFARHIRRPAPLAARTAEVRERVAADGRVLVPLDTGHAQAVLRDARASGIDSVAICLMHGHRFPAHEAALARLARQEGFQQVSASHEVAPLIRFVPRGDTTLADAYLSPVVTEYVGAVVRALPARARLLVMQSGGGLAAAEAVRGKDAVLSGPAGGVVGMAAAGTAAGHDRLIGFDMGGTSTDVSHFAGGFERSFETEVAGVRLRVPMLDIRTVAAGGGSICRFEAGRLVVGPQSAGAVPGPASYGRGGPPTVTDCNLVLGRIQPSAFPRVFGPSGDAPLDAAAARAALNALGEEVCAATGEAVTVAALAEGLVAIANAHMADAIRQISIARGHDPADHGLVVFGGAGGQHGCALAEALGIGTIIIPADAGLLSASGIAAAPLSVTRERTVALPFDGTLDAALGPASAALAADARAALLEQDVPLDTVTADVRAHVRYDGADTAIPVPLGTEAELRRAFSERHQARFGFLTDSAGLLLDTLEAEARGTPPGGSAGPAAAADVAPTPEPITLIAGGRCREALLFHRAQLPPGFAVPGLAIIADSGSTTFIAPGWAATVHASGALLLEKSGGPTEVQTAPEAIRLELLNALFMGIATEMGTALAASARSVNMKERLDFSCAVFDAEGGLVANAPHMPVHLGSMGESVRAIIRARGSDGRGIRDGDVYALNAPWAGGTHLPDITVIRPVFLGSGSPGAWVAARGHHADVGGITPGSMPPQSRSLDEEGVVLDDVLLVSEGRFREAELRALFEAGPFPARDVARNLADLQAQLAACQRGAVALGEAAVQLGGQGLARAMQDIQDNAADAVKALIATLSDGEADLPMDDGARIRVSVRVDREAPHLDVDFSGTSQERPGNLNAPPSVTRAALLYVLRTLLDVAIPLNDGCLRHVTLNIPEGSMLAPRPGAAVVGGNVETSQVVTDALFLALGAMAASAGSMSNLTFGNACHQYYETISGGSGAGPGFPGTAAVQTHMTNSRLTDPEVLETRHPVRLERFAIRRRSGGSGRWPGGDGAVRRLMFEEAMTVAILSNRRLTAPPGLAGGGDGAPGANRIIRADGRVEALGPTERREVMPGDAFEIETPGGGGFGD